MLELALSGGDCRRELLAYDYVGLSYFYCGLLDEANFFHNKMKFGDIEPKNS
jgi:hypothetical protein